jgi:hypothetical protein
MKPKNKTKKMTEQEVVFAYDGFAARVNNTKELARLLCQFEGKHSQVNIAQMSEIVKILAMLIKADYRVLKVLLK